jgi:hypothetical protein
MSARTGLPGQSSSAAYPRRWCLCTALLVTLATHPLAGHSMAATPSFLTAPAQSHCTGRFDYALPATLRFTGGQQSLVLITVDSELSPPGTPASSAWKRRLASVLTKPGRVAATMREFDLAGVGPAAWRTLLPTRPDLVTLLAMKPLQASNAVLFLQFEASAGREPVVERVFGKLAATWTPDTPQGFCSGPGAFVVAPSMNERALAAFGDASLELTVQTETVSEPDDGQSSGDALPPGGQLLSKQHRSVAGFDGIEERMQIPDGKAGQHRIYSWVFPGRPADGVAPRIRFTATAVSSRAADLDVVWNALMASWRPRPVGVR